MTLKHSWIDKLIRSPSGKVIIWQTPNFPLTAWALLNLVALTVSEGRLHSGFNSLATAFLLLWAYQEIKDGESLFRRLLGSIVMAVIIVSFFK